MSKKLSYEEVKQYIENIEEYKLLDNFYINCRTKSKIQCHKGHIFNMTFDAFRSGKRCPVCNNENRKLSYEEVKKYIEDFNYKLISDSYINNSTKLEMKCEKGHICSMIFNNFKKGQRCSECSGNKKLTYSQIKMYIEKESNYTLLSDEYINALNKLKIRCNQNHVFDISFNNFKSGKRCPICSGNKKKTFEEVNEYIEKTNYKLISNSYKNNRTKLKIMCSKKHIFNMSFHDFDSGSRCPICKESKGEKIISNYLINHNINYESQYTFADCKYKRKLKFDFVVFNKNNKILFLIEYDGEQHFRPVNFGFNNKDFEITKKRDEIKNTYCKNNNIKLLRIPYWEFDNIDKILEENLKDGR